MSHKYGVKYKLETGSFEGEDLKKEGAGGCDALVLCSIMREGKEPHEGPVSFAFFSVDGREHGPINQAPSITDEQLFEVWASLAHVISEKTCLTWQREIASQVLNTVRSLLAASANGKERTGALE